MYRMLLLHYLSLRVVLHGKILSLIIQMEKQRHRVLNQLLKVILPKKEKIQDLTHFGP